MDGWMDGKKNEWMKYTWIDGLMDRVTIVKNLT